MPYLYGEASCQGLVDLCFFSSSLESIQMYLQLLKAVMTLGIHSLSVDTLLCYVGTLYSIRIQADIIQADVPENPAERPHFQVSKLVNLVEIIVLLFDILGEKKQLQMSTYGFITLFSGLVLHS